MTFLKIHLKAQVQLRTTVAMLIWLAALNSSTHRLDNLHGRVWYIEAEKCVY